MLDCVFLVPIDHRGIQGKLFPQYLELQSWCEKNNSQIFTCNGLFLNFARNYLATGGKGMANTTPPECKWLFWIDSDIAFNIQQIETLLSMPDKYRFLNGWYRSAFDDNAMCGMWDKEFFDKHQYMPFLSVEDLTKKGEKDPKSVIQVDFSGFGFTRLDTNIISEMTYPYFTLNVVNLGQYRDMSFDDVSFCQNCEKETGVKPFVMPALRVAHNKSFFV